MGPLLVDTAAERWLAPRHGTLRYGSARWSPLLGLSVSEADLQMPGIALRGLELDARLGAMASLHARAPCRAEARLHGRRLTVDLDALRSSGRGAARSGSTRRCRHPLARLHGSLEAVRVRGRPLPHNGHLEGSGLSLDWDAGPTTLRLSAERIQIGALLSLRDIAVELAIPSRTNLRLLTLHAAHLVLRRHALVEALGALLRRKTSAQQGDSSGPTETARHGSLHLEGPVTLEHINLVDADGSVLWSGRLDWHTAEGHGILRLQGEDPHRGGRISVEWDIPLAPSGRPEPRRGRWRVRIGAMPASVLADWLPEVPWDPSAEGSLEITGSLWRDGHAVHWRGALNARGLRLVHPGLAPTPVELPPLRIRAEGVWSSRDGTLRIVEGSLSAREVHIGFKGSVRRGASGLPHVTLEASLPPDTSCRHAFEAVPHALRSPALDDFAWDGTMGGHLLLRIDPEASERSTLRLAVQERCTFTRVPAWASPTRLRGPFAYRIVAADGSTRIRRSGPGSPRWTPLSAISPFFLHALLAAEDASFFRHAGFAPWAIDEAFRRNLAAGRFVLGASTLSMQLARNLFLSRDKTLARKLQEVVLTWWLERSLSKAELLALYVNVVEFGPDLYGIGPAAHHYFGREPAALSAAEGAFLASVLPAPLRYHRAFEQGAPSPAARRRIERLLRHMAERNRIDEAALQEGLAELNQGLRFRDPEEHVAPPRPAPMGRAAELPVPHAGRTEPLAPQEAADEPVDWEAGWDTPDAPEAGSIRW